MTRLALLAALVALSGCAVAPVHPVERPVAPGVFYPQVADQCGRQPWLEWCKP